MLLHAFIIIFGAVVGSFLNVVIFRYNSGESIFEGRSRCFSCGKTLRWFELLPIISFIAQKRRCRNCGSKISWQYPVVEAVTGLLFLLVYLKFSGHSLSIISYWLIVVSLLMVIVVYDFHHKIIPGFFVWSFNFLALLFVFLGEIPNWKFIISQIASGLAFASFFALLWAVSCGKWMGLGDAKLALGLGWLLGWEKTLAAFLFSFWLGAFFSVLLLIFKRGRFTMKSQIPFGPFLVAGSLIALFLDVDLTNLFSFYG